MTVLITVWGASPGAGKSTLCAGLAARWGDTGLRVDHFREEEMLSRPQFASVAEEFNAKGTVRLTTLLSATAQFVDAVAASGDDVVIADALMPYIPTLLAMGHDDETIDAFMADLTAVLAPLRPVMLFLDADVGSALSRATAREGDQWPAWYVGKLARYAVTPRVTDLPSAITYLRSERSVTLDAVRRHGWNLAVIDRADELSPAAVLRIAERHVTPRLAPR